MSDVDYPIGSVEYVKVTVTGDVTLDAQTVAISIDKGTTWLPAQWLGDAGTTREARTSTPVTFAARIHPPRPVYVKVTDTPEIPIIKTRQRLSASA